MSPGSGQLEVSANQAGQADSMRLHAFGVAVVAASALLGTAALALPGSTYPPAMPPTPVTAPPAPNEPNESGALANADPNTRPDAQRVAPGGALAARVNRPERSWRWPVRPQPGHVVRRFVQPDTAWSAGHRGIDLELGVGQPVVAVAPGVITHAGVVARRGTLTLRDAAGVRATYEPVVAAVRSGQTVERGQVLGRLALTPGHCAPSACLHLGAIWQDRYLDPLLLLHPGRVRLLPLR